MVRTRPSVVVALGGQEVDRLVLIFFVMFLVQFLVVLPEPVTGLNALERLAHEWRPMAAGCSAGLVALEEHGAIVLERFEDSILLDLFFLAVFFVIVIVIVVIFMISDGNFFVIVDFFNLVIIVVVVVVVILMFIEGRGDRLNVNVAFIVRLLGLIDRFLTIKLFIVVIFVVMAMFIVLTVMMFPVLTAMMFIVLMAVFFVVMAIPL